MGRMAKVAAEVTPEEMAVYRATARRRWERKRREAILRRERAWRFARRAARLLKEQFGAMKVVVFGSLTRGGLFHARSDVDLAVWGIDERMYYRAVSHLLSLDPAISVDLVEAETARPALRAAIEREGVPL